MIFREELASYLLPPSERREVMGLLEMLLCLLRLSEKRRNNNSENPLSRRRNDGEKTHLRKAVIVWIKILIYSRPNGDEVCCERTRTYVRQ